MRSLGRVSTESVRDITFSVFLEGPPAQFPAAGRALMRRTHRKHRIQRRGRASSRWTWISLAPSGVSKAGFFSPLCRARWWKSPSRTPLPCMAAGFTPPLPDAAADRPSGGAETADRRTGAADAQRAFVTAVELLVAAFSHQAGLAGSARAAASAAAYGQVRRHVEARLHDPDLSPESVLASLQLTRQRVPHVRDEGGLAAYIRNRRLRMAADELVRFPHRSP